MRYPGKQFLLWSLVVVQIFSAAAEDRNGTAPFIQRTMKQLEDSTPEAPADVRILFYGQSITAQPWTTQVEEKLRFRYPSVQFEFANPAIGGFYSSRLLRTAEHDLYPWYPDLLIFHVYGPMGPYEQIIRSARERTAAEIVLWTDHVSVQDQKTQNEQDQREIEIAEIAKKYDCMVVNIREKWRTNLAETGRAPESYLKDHVHLNPDGCALLAKLIEEELIRFPGLDDQSPFFDAIQTVDIDSDAVTVDPDGTIHLSFSGNRVVAVSNGKGSPAAKANVLLDGCPVEEFCEMWAATRPRGALYGHWMPPIKQVGFKVVPDEQQWEIKVFPDSDPNGKRIHFELYGSETGYDGSGWSDQTFTSSSGKVFIDCRDWWVNFILNYEKKELPPDFSITWMTYPLCASQIGAGPAGERTVLVQGCRNGSHELTLVSENGNIGIDQFIIYSPPAICQSGQ